MHRLAGLACVCFACGYSTPTPPGSPGDAFVEPKLDAPPVSDCEPNQTFCNVRDRVTCNATGDGAAITVTCPLMCLEATAQCHSASYIADLDQQACAGNPPTFMPTGNVTIDRDNNDVPRITCSGGCGPAATEILGTVVNQLGGGPQIAMFCLRQITLPNVRIGVNNVPHPIALFSLQDAIINADIDISGGNAGIVTTGSRGPGGGGGGDLQFVFDNRSGEPGGEPCGGGGGNHNGSGTNSAGGGGGGGGNLAVGGTGGQGSDLSGNTTANGGTGGPACGTAVVLGGGGGGGSGGDGPCTGACGAGAGGGGGAMLIASGGNLQFNAPSSLSANGGNGFGTTNGGAGGGGAGGMFVIEGKAVLLGGNFLLRGGNGGDSSAPGGGGEGADGSNTTGENGPSEQGQNQGGAGGGGGAGRLVVRTPTDPGAICGPSSAKTDPSNVCTVETLRTFP